MQNTMFIIRNSVIVNDWMRGGIVAHHTFCAHLYPNVAGMVMLRLNHDPVPVQIPTESNLYCLQ